MSESRTWRPTGKLIGSLARSPLTCVNSCDNSHSLLIPHVDAKAGGQAAPDLSESRHSFGGAPLVSPSYPGSFAPSYGMHGHHGNTLQVLPTVTRPRSNSNRSHTTDEFKVHKRTPSQPKGRPRLSPSVSGSHVPAASQHRGIAGGHESAIVRQHLATIFAEEQMRRRDGQGSGSEAPAPERSLGKGRAFRGGSLSSDEEEEMARGVGGPGLREGRSRQGRWA